MNKHLAVILIAFTVLASVQAGKDVVELTDSNFDKEVMTSDDIWFIKFYTPWCGHCKELAPHWDKLATETKGQVKISEVNCDESR